MWLLCMLALGIPDSACSCWVCGRLLALSRNGADLLNQHREMRPVCRGCVPKDYDVARMLPPEPLAMSATAGAWVN